MAVNLLEAEIRRKAFETRQGRRTVLENLEIQLSDREVVAVVGPSGCGKTTLLKIIGGLDSDFDGEVRWRGGVAPRIGTVFQEPRLLPWRTVEQNIRLVLPGKPDPELAAGLLRDLQLWDHRAEWASRLSLGMARRLSIARAFAIEPAVLLLDEPFVSLDEALARQSRDLLLQVWQRRPTAVLLVTHDLAEAAMLADRVLLLSTAPARVVSEYTVPAASRRQGPAAADEIVDRLRALIRLGGASGLEPGSS